MDKTSCHALKWRDSNVTIVQQRKMGGVGRFVGFLLFSFFLGGSGRFVEHKTGDISRTKRVAFVCFATCSCR